MTKKQKKSGVDEGKIKHTPFQLQLTAATYGVDEEKIKHENEARKPNTNTKHAHNLRPGIVGAGFRV